MPIQLGSVVCPRTVATTAHKVGVANRHCLVGLCVVIDVIDVMYVGVFQAKATPSIRDGSSDIAKRISLSDSEL